MPPSAAIDHVGRYTILDPIRQGGAGEVVRAYDNELRRPVAIKRLISTDASSDAASRLLPLLREARAVANISHPNILAVHDVIEVSGVVSVVMELAEGGSLEDRARCGRQLSVHQALEWLLDAARGLARAHDDCLVHRHVVPRNLLLTREGRLKVADFGLTPEAGGSASAAEADGTPRHVAPEVLRGGADDARSDQHGWAIVAYWLLGGIHPYDSQHEAPSRDDIAAGRFVPWPLVLRTPGLPLAVEEVVFRALQSDPSARFADMHALAAALEAARRGASLERVWVTPASTATTSDPSAPYRSPIPSSSEPTGRALELAAPPTIRHEPLWRRRRSRPLVAAAAFALVGGAATSALVTRERPQIRTTTEPSHSGGQSGPPASAARPALCGTDGRITALALAGDTLYVGGSFEAIACPTGSGALFDPQTGRRKGGVAAPMIAGEVDAAVPDPARPGGFYVGGRFHTIGDVEVGHLVRILPDGTVDPTFAPRADDAVRSIVVGDDTVYVAGKFNHIGGTARRSMAALDVRTGAPRADFTLEPRYVESLALVDDTLYLGGYFDDVAEQPRTSLAAVDAKTGRLLPWKPKLDGSVALLATSGRTLFVLGSAGRGFTQVDGVKHPGSMAAFDTRTGAQTSFNPVVDRVPETFLAHGNKVYVAGSFDVIGGAKREGVAALDASTGRPTSFAVPGVRYGVKTLALRGTTLYLGGAFETIGETVRRGAAAVDVATEALTDFDPSLTASANAIAVSGDAVFVGGEFAAYGAKERKYLSAIDVKTGQHIDVGIDLDRPVAAMVAQGGELIVAGSFSEVGGHGRRGVAKIDLATRKVTDWSPNVERGSVDSMVVASDGTVYIAGSFERVGGETRGGIAAIHGTTGRPTAFRATTTSSERYARHTALAVVGHTLYFGGDFETVNGTDRARLAALDGMTGEVLPFRADADGAIEGIAANENGVFVQGSFTNVGGRPVRHLAALDPSGAPLVAGLDGVIDSRCSALTIAGNLLYGGCSTGQSGVIAFDLTTMRYLPFKVGFGGRSATAFAIGEDVVYAGGNFEYAGGRPRANLAAFAASSGEVF